MAVAYEKSTTKCRNPKCGFILSSLSIVWECNISAYNLNINLFIQLDADVVYGKFLIYLMM